MSKTMHILHVTPYYPPTWAYGGIPRIVDGLSRAQEQQGHRISVLTTDVFDAHKRNGLPLFREEHNIQIINLPNLSNRLAHRQLFLPQKQHVLQTISRPDIIHMHGHRHLLNDIAYRYAKKNNIPFVLTANGTLHRHERWITIKKLWDQIFSNKIIEHAKHFVSVSPFDTHIHRKEGIPEQKITHIPNGLDLGEFSPLPPRSTFRNAYNLDDRPIVAYLGQLSPRKGVLHLIEACKTLSHIHLVIAGNDMGVGKQVQDMAKKYENILCTGLLSGTERLSLLRDSSMLVYPSTNEVFGLSPFEGLLCGAPAIVSDDCGCGQLISKAQAGLLIRYGDIQDIRDKIKILLQDDEMRTIMVQRGRNYINKHLSFSQIANNHIDLYQMVLAKNE
jgi:glycosyltransferase involved in cell wall biosynthesis